MGETEYCHRLFTIWERYHDSEYMVYCSSKPRTHRYAREKCRSFGGALASIHGDDENDFVHDLIQRTVKGKTFAWIGLRSWGNDWDWSDLTLYRYNRFGDDEPHIKYKDDYCAAVTPSNKRWSGLSCNGGLVHAYVCRKFCGEFTSDEKEKCEKDKTRPFEAGNGPDKEKL
ncbi:hypothetical protein Y032_0027g1521 [Ancylostoma ceylanicum]|nr:hypothetical protein Y032_0027g1521 [Ancylostoma ceylanicum]